MQVASDNGDLELDKVFELIAEGENLPIHFEKELKVLSKWMYPSLPVRCS